jgi:hypothetical protein
MKERDILTVDLFPEKTPFPKFTPEECLKQTAEDMLHLLKLSTASPTAAPLSVGPPILNACKSRQCSWTCCCRTASSSTSDTTTNCGTR